LEIFCVAATVVDVTFPLLLTVSLTLCKAIELTIDGPTCSELLTSSKSRYSRFSKSKSSDNAYGLIEMEGRS